MYECPTYVEEHDPNTWIVSSLSHVHTLSCPASEVETTTKVTEAGGRWRKRWCRGGDSVTRWKQMGILLKEDRIRILVYFGHHFQYSGASHGPAASWTVFIRVSVAPMELALPS